MMSIENPETFNEIVCVAPAEGQRPLSIMTDSSFETMSNPEKFPIGDGCFAANFKCLGYTTLKVCLH